MEPKSKISQVMQALLVQKKKKRGGRAGGRRGGDGWWYFQVYRHAMESDLLAFKPGLPCICQVCSIVMNSRVHLCVLFSEERSREPSHSRAGRTSIGLEIKRTPLSDQNFSSASSVSLKRPISFVRQSGSAARPQPKLRPLQRGNTAEYEALSGVLALSKNGPFPVEMTRMETQTHYYMIATTAKAAVNPCS
ncbi:hypothetical protein PAMP_016648 [Pampus punctatissimus]